MSKRVLNFKFPPSACIDCWSLSHKECPEGYTEPSKTRIACKNHIKDNNQDTIQCRDCMRDYLGNCPETSDTQCEVIMGNINCKSYHKRNTKQMNEQQNNDICTGCFRMTSKECTGKEFKSIHGTGGDTICFNYKLPPKQKLNEGVKYDGDKPRVALVLGGFIRAIGELQKHYNLHGCAIGDIRNTILHINQCDDLYTLNQVLLLVFQEMVPEYIHEDTSEFFKDFYKPLLEVCQVGTFGAKKYDDNNWMGLQDGEKRTLDAAMRHIMAYMSGEINNHEEFEKDGVKYTCDLPHLGHAAWELLACIEFARYRLGLESTVREAQEKLKVGN